MFRVVPVATMLLLLANLAAILADRVRHRCDCGHTPEDRKKRARSLRHPGIRIWRGLRIVELEERRRRSRACFGGIPIFGFIHDPCSKKRRTPVASAARSFLITV